MGKTALITGITGQDGSYLAELLLGKGYEVHGLERRSSDMRHERIAHLEGKPGFSLHYGDLTDASSLSGLICSVKPDEVYNLAAQSDVAASFDIPVYTGDADALGTTRLLEAVRCSGMAERTRIYQASTSELFGRVEEVPQNEDTPFHPYSPYAVAKLYAHWMVREYREAYGMYCCAGILFNHESPRRGECFVTRKITRAVARIASGAQDELRLGNLSSLRDWGHARDYVECMHLMLQQDEPRDYVIATGVQHSVREFASLAFERAGMPLRWEGEGLDELGIEEATGRVLVRVDPAFFRPTDVVNLLGDSTRAREDLGWDPSRTSFEELVFEMVDADLALEGVERG